MIIYNKVDKSELAYPSDGDATKELGDMPIGVESSAGRFEGSSRGHEERRKKVKMVARSFILC